MDRRKTHHLALAGIIFAISWLFPGSGSLAQSVAQSTGPVKRVRVSLEGFDLAAKRSDHDGKSGTGPPGSHVVAGGSPNQVPGGSRGIFGPILAAPTSGKAYSLNPTFQWQTLESNQKVSFRLTAIDGQTLYETTTAQDHLTYPADAPPLKPGESYRWTVAVESDMLGKVPEPVTFGIISGSERDAITDELKSSSSPSAVATIFVNHRVWYDAIQSYTSQLAVDVNNRDARMMRAQLYDQLPATKTLADADWSLIH